MGFNARLFEIVLYEDGIDFESLGDKLSSLSGCRDYAYIVHDQCISKKTGQPLKKHVHVMLRMHNPHNSQYVAKWFDAAESQVEKCKGRWADMLAYLTHANAPDKIQYDPAKVISNFDWAAEASRAGSKNNQRLNEIVNQIVDGTCREYNYTELITPEEYVKYAAQIDRAYKYRSDKIKKMERNMRVIYICGEPGAGKTTYAKEIAKEQGYRPFLAGSSNDPLDGYKGEDCLILDDLRASSMSISDLLKMLDNHTGSLVRSRYRNKFLECKLVIITSIKTIDELYTMFLEQSEPLDQFKRRCSTMIHMTKEKVRVFGWDISKSDYEHIVTWPNFVLANIKKVYLTDEKKEEIKRELLGSKKAMVEKMIEEEEEGEEEEKEAMGEVLKIFGGEVVNTNFKLPKS